MSVLKDGLEVEKPPVNLIDFVMGFRRRLFLVWKLASKNLVEAQGKIKRLFDRRAEARVFSPGEQVLALLPIVGSLFQAKFAGPYSVVRQVTDLDYLVATPDRKRATQMCHVNLLKPYFSVQSESATVGTVALTASGMMGPVQKVPSDREDTGPDDSLLLPGLKNSETLRNFDGLLSHLPVKQKDELKHLILSFPALFSDTPSCTNVLTHDIELIDQTPIKQRFYRVPLVKPKILETEVQYLLDSGLAEPSSSSWASPCLLVPKSDGMFRFCTDYLKVNKVTKPDSFPLPRIDDCIDRVGAAKYVSKFDLLKGNYQIPLTKRAQDISAFITPSGLYFYRVMSFGQRNGPATFQRLVSKVTSGLKGCSVYLDDVVIHSETWEEHLAAITDLFERLLRAKLTVNLAKCEFAQATVVYLGKVVGQGQVLPVNAKVEAIDGYPPPKTKKELVRFLGMIGYNRSFCLNFSSVVAPLTNLLKSTVKFVWSPECQKAFENAKLLLSSAPVLAAPKLDQPFKIHVDAS